MMSLATLPHQILGSWLIQNIQIWSKEVLRVVIFLLSHMQPSKKRRMFLRSDKTPQRLMSHKAYLSSILRRDALGFIPREKEAGGLVDQPYSTLPGAVQKMMRAVQDWFADLICNWLTYTIHTQHVFTSCKRQKTWCHLSNDYVTIHGSLHFYLGLNMCFHFKELNRTFTSASVLHAKA